MSQPLSIVKQTEQGFNEFGQVSESRESYVKVSTSFRRGPLAFFSGAQLKVFFCIALHEADDEPGVSLTAIMHECSLSKPTVIDSLRFLSDKVHPFIKGFGREDDGTRIWRVCAFAWAGGGKKILPPEKKFFSHDDDVPVHKPEIEHHHHDRASEKIFASAGFQGKNLTELGARVDADTARAWANWAKVANRSEYRNPIGYAWACLKADPRANPPAVRRKRAFSDGYEWCTHGTREHAEYCRAHPGAFKCDCGDEVEE